MPDAEPAPASPRVPPAPGRIWLAMVVGMLLAVPAGWLLAPVALLPGQLGLFFFLIVGLLIGATMYRLGKPAAPVPRSRTILIGLAVALTLWLSTLISEYRAMPQVGFAAVRSQLKVSLPPERREHIQEEISAHISSQLNKMFPPGGLIGYLRWAATDGTMDLPRVIDQRTVRFSLPQRGVWWMVRVVFSLILTAGAILALIWPLGPEKNSKAEPSQPGSPSD